MSAAGAVLLRLRAEDVRREFVHSDFGQSLDPGPHCRLVADERQVFGPARPSRSSIAR